MQTSPDNAEGPFGDLASFYSRLADVQRSRFAAAVRDYVGEAGEAGRAWAEGMRTANAIDFWRDASGYWLDFSQRSLLFWDTMRRRGNNWIEHEKAGKPPLLAFEYELVTDGRTLERPVNYSLVRIKAPEGVSTDPDKRPFLIIDPRAGHGPGIGGFKQESEVGFALKAGHPVYFITFAPDPVDGQTLADVAAAESEFLKIIGDRHSTRGKPAIIGNCQGGWAAMLVAALDPDRAGPVVVNGAPMSYWAGNDAENPMRYAGGILGGTWPALLASDLGGGKFDGAYLVDNFEYLNPANTFVTKYYNLFSKIDTESDRFLEFERWWGGFFLMNRDEIRWIVENLFVGNRLADGGAEWAPGQAFDLRGVNAPIVLFASLGDNITPPQQAFNWVADVYPTTEMLKANGQVIVGLMHENVGHLGIFVSGAVARREHAQIIDLLEVIEHLPPGLYAMRIEEQLVDGDVRYDVELTERRVEELHQLQKYGRRDELPFRAVSRVSEFNTRFYESFVHPILAAVVTPEAATVARTFHPLRMQRWACSDLNPWFAGIGALSEFAVANRLPRDEHGPCAATERLMAKSVIAGLDLFRQFRDATVENVFFNVYGPMSLFAADTADEERAEAETRRPVARTARAVVGKDGFTAAAVRAALLTMRHGKQQKKLSVLKRVRELVGSEVGLLDMPVDDARALVQQQSMIVDRDSEEALRTLPALLRTDSERRHVVDLLERLAHNLDLTAEQRAFLPELTHVLSSHPDTLSDGSLLLRTNAPSGNA
jgi:pimeloyl-ACP methyl ester carboxylesterase